MANHTSDVFVVKTKDGEYVTGDAFWPNLTSEIKKATRLSLLKDAKTYVKTAARRLRLKGTDVLIIQPVTEVRDKKFALMDVLEKGSST